MQTAASLSPLDWALIAVLAVSVGIGLWRGIVFELLSLAAWGVAWVAAQLWGPAWGARLSAGEAGSAMGGAAGYALCFIAALIVCGLLARLARLLISVTPLQLFDRLLGAGFGLVRGLLILLAVATLVAMTPAGHSAVWQASRGAAWLGAAVDTLKPLWPASRAG